MSTFVSKEDRANYEFRLSDEQVEDIRQNGASAGSLYRGTPCPHPNPKPYHNCRCEECYNLKRRLNFRKKQNFDERWEKQKGLCAFCHEPMDYESNSIHLDHDHASGRKRGLVHSRCNTMIAGIENAMKTIGLDSAMQYILGDEAYLVKPTLRRVASASK
jgi:Recombination endonuclease VII